MILVGGTARRRRRAGVRARRGGRAPARLPVAARDRATRLHPDADRRPVDRVPENGRTTPDRGPPGSGSGYIIADIGALLLLIALDRRRDRRPPAQERRRQRAAEVEHGDLVAAARRVHRHDLGDEREADLTFRRRTPRIPLHGTGPCPFSSASDRGLPCLRSIEAIRSGPEAGFAGREANEPLLATAVKEGARGGTMGFPTQNDHGLLTWEPAIGRQKTGLAARLAAACRAHHPRSESGVKGPWSQVVFGRTKRWDRGPEAGFAGREAWRPLLFASERGGARGGTRGSPTI